jgi:hypothetical protein
VKLGAALALLAASCTKPQTFEEGMREVCALGDRVTIDGGVDDRVEQLTAGYKARVTNIGVHAILDRTEPPPSTHEERDAMIAEALRIAGIGPCWLRPPDAGP